MGRSKGMGGGVAGIRETGSAGSPVGVLLIQFSSGLNFCKYTSVFWEAFQMNIFLIRFWFSFCGHVHRMCGFWGDTSYIFLWFRESIFLQPHILKIPQRYKAITKDCWMMPFSFLLFTFSVFRFTTYHKYSSTTNVIGTLMIYYLYKNIIKSNLHLFLDILFK